MSKTREIRLWRLCLSRSYGEAWMQRGYIDAPIRKRFLLLTLSWRCKTGEIDCISLIANWTWP